MVKNKLSYKQLGSIVGVSAGYLRHVACGLRKPSAELAMALERLSNGEVSFFSLRGQKKPRKKMPFGRRKAK